MAKPGGYIVTAWTTAPLYAAANHNALVMIGIQAVVIAAAVLLFIFYVRSLIGRPLDGLSQSIRRLQDGEYDIEVPFQQRRDEIGFVARALDTFRTESIVKQEEGVAAENNRKAFEAERVQNAEQVAATAQNQTETIAVVAKALEELADGNFDTRLENLPEDFAKLASDFNRMVNAVSTTLSEIKTVSDSVGTGSNELANSADLLARRTEQTAASLEETAASLQEMTTTVKESSVRAQEAGQLVNKTKTDAATSSKVVREAVGAMDSIKASSSQIGQTISVINDIAFQTNLLALNAGVEAARAGEAGAGFAVVAYEVRELAQRCATAAKEISELIADSDREVATGVDLVRKTGDALIDIEKQVNDINDGIHAIVGAYREQSTGLEEINVAVVSMDQTTQQNAAMVEETNAACQELRSQSTKLNAAVSRFTLSGSMEQPAAEPEKPKTGPVNKNTARPRAMAVAGNTALATQPGEWEEF
jgi:methyl-accepting chemotaxis protein